MKIEPPIKPVIWVGSSRKDLMEFPEVAKAQMGYALHLAQAGGKHFDAKPLSGFGGAGVVEIVKRHDGDTFRAVYTVKIASAVYVLHAFQKKAKSGIKTPQADMELIEKRLRDAQRIAKERRP